MMSLAFENFAINKNILSGLAEAGFTEATPIQERSIKPILAGQQVVGIAQTGTGKTAAFAIPILMKLNYAQGNTIRALIIEPTRELAMQTASHLKLLGKFTGLRIAAIYGGTGSLEQKKLIEEGLDILVATPGRLHELYIEGVLNFKKIEVFVIDEADKMMDMGFIRAIHQLLEVLPRKKQCLLFSATMTARVEKLYHDFMEFPLLIEASPQATPAELVQQVLFTLPNFKTKINFLLYLLTSSSDFSKTIIFCKTKVSANQIFKFLSRKLGEEKLRVIHGNKDQNSRINAMQELREGQASCLVATDVAARGIDIPEIGCVINFDVPLVAEDYVHRIGRTGRAGSNGKSITFCTPSELYYVTLIEKLIRQKISLELLPNAVIIEATPYAEQQLQDREIDMQRKKDDPTFKGAFHEKKNAVARKVKSKQGESKASSKGKFNEKVQRKNKTSADPGKEGRIRRSGR